MSRFRIQETIRRWMRPAVCVAAALMLLLFGPTSVAGASPLTRYDGAQLVHTAQNPAVSSNARTLQFLPPYSAPGSWTWNASCPQSPCNPTGPDPIFGSIQLNADLWNLGSAASGDVRSTLTSRGTLKTAVNFASAPSGSWATFVRGYPNLLYGVNPFSASSSPPVDARLALPMQLSSLPRDVISTASYELSNTSSVAYDFAYDMWIETQRRPRTPGARDLELMVWTAQGNHALPPRSQYVTTVAMPFSENAVGQSGTWDVYANNPQLTQTGHATTVYIILHSPINDAEIGIDLNKSLRAMESTLQSYFPATWGAVNLNGYWLDAVSLGSEFGPPPSGSSSAAVQYQWSLSNYHYTLNGTLPPLAATSVRSVRRSDNSVPGGSLRTPSPNSAAPAGARVARVSGPTSSIPARARQPERDATGVRSRRAPEAPQRVHMQAAQARRPELDATEAGERRAPEPLPRDHTRMTRAETSDTRRDEGHRDD